MQVSHRTAAAAGSAASAAPNRSSAGRSLSTAAAPPSLIGLSQSAPRPSTVTSSLLLSPLFTFSTYTPGPHRQARLPGLQSCLQWMEEKNMEACAVKAHHYAQIEDWSSAREMYMLMTQWIDGALANSEVGRHAGAGFLAEREAKIAHFQAHEQPIRPCQAGEMVAAEAIRRAEVAGGGKDRSGLHPFVLPYLAHELRAIRPLLQSNVAEVEAAEAAEAWNQPVALQRIGRHDAEGKTVLFRSSDERQQWEQSQQQQKRERQSQAEQRQLELREQEAELAQRLLLQKQQKEQQWQQQKERLERFKQQEQLSRMAAQQGRQLQLQDQSAAAAQPPLPGLQPTSTNAQSRAAVATATAAAVTAAAPDYPIPALPPMERLQPSHPPFFHHVSAFTGRSKQPSGRSWPPVAAAAAATASSSSTRTQPRKEMHDDSDLEILSEPDGTPSVGAPNTPAAGADLFLHSSHVDAAAASVGTIRTMAATNAIHGPQLSDETSSQHLIGATAAVAATAEVQPTSLHFPEPALQRTSSLLSDDDEADDIFIPLPAPPPAPKLQPTTHSDGDEDDAPLQPARRDRSKRRAVLLVDDTPETRGEEEEEDAEGEMADEIIAYIESGRSTEPRGMKQSQSQESGAQMLQVSAIDEVRSPQTLDPATADPNPRKRRRYTSDAPQQSQQSQPPQQQRQPTKAERSSSASPAVASISIRPLQLRKRPRSSLSEASSGRSSDPAAEIEVAAEQHAAPSRAAATTRKESKKAKKAKPEPPQTSAIDADSIQQKPKKRLSKAAASSSSPPPSQSQRGHTKAVVPASPLEVRAQFKHHFTVAASTKAAGAGSTHSSKQLAASLAAAAGSAGVNQSIGPAPSPSTSVESPLPAKVRKLVTDAATGVRRYEWVFEQRSWARPNRRLESRMETVQPPPAARVKGKAPGIIATMRPVKVQSAVDEEKKTGAGVLAATVLAQHPTAASTQALRSTQLSSPSLDTMVIGPSATPPQS